MESIGLEKKLNNAGEDLRKTSGRPPIFSKRNLVNFQFEKILAESEKYSSKFSKNSVKKLSKFVKKLAFFLKKRKKEKRQTLLALSSKKSQTIDINN